MDLSSWRRKRSECSQESCSWWSFSINSYNFSSRMTCLYRAPENNRHSIKKRFPRYDLRSVLQTWWIAQTAHNCTTDICVQCNNGTNGLNDLNEIEQRWNSQWQVHACMQIECRKEAKKNVVSTAKLSRGFHLVAKVGWLIKDKSMHSSIDDLLETSVLSS